MINKKYIAIEGAIGVVKQHLQKKYQIQLNVKLYLKIILLIHLKDFMIIINKLFSTQVHFY